MSKIKNAYSLERSQEQCLPNRVCHIYIRAYDRIFLLLEFHVMELVVFLEEYDTRLTTIICFHVEWTI